MRQSVIEVTRKKISFMMIQMKNSGKQVQMTLWCCYKVRMGIWEQMRMVMKGFKEGLNMV